MIYCITAAEFVAEVCDNEVFEAQCHEGEVMRIERALYSRMRLGRCVKTDRLRLHRLLCGRDRCSARAMLRQITL